jgi:hypothetical protein
MPTLDRLTTPEPVSSSAAVPTTKFPTLNVTVPVGMAVPAVSLTFPVRVTAELAGTGLGEIVSAVVVEAIRSIRTGELVEPLKVGLPE